jgi:hypothetical protein
MCLPGTALALAFALLALPAVASETFPPRIQKDLGLRETPDCVLCHETEKGGTNTVNRPFGVSMRKAGLKAGNLGLLDEALMKLEADGTDSDGDGVPDIEELKKGRNPNAQEHIVVTDAGAGADGGRTITIVETPPPAPTVPLLETGCEVTPGARCARTSGRPALLLSGALAIALARRLRRSRATRPTRARHSQ